jgi:DNA polymerase I
MARTIILLDGDQYLHRACAAVEKELEWDAENIVLYSNCEEAWEVVTGGINKVLEHFAERDYIICLSATEDKDFRKEIDPTYKASRAGKRKPMCFKHLKNRLMADRPCRWQAGLEADDVMGILATKPGPDVKIIVSRDKDMKTIPAQIWTEDCFYNVSEIEANYWHLFQTLVGDVVDGYKGCPGIGPKTAAKLLDAPVSYGANGPHKELWLRVVAAYTKAGLTAEDALRNARLARILRWSDWDSIDKKPILWSPPTL